MVAVWGVALSWWRRKVLQSPFICQSCGRFLLMLSRSWPKRAQYSSDVMDSPRPFHSVCTKPLQSKKAVSMVDCLVQDRRALRGRWAPFGIHWVSLILDSGSKVWNELSSPVMILCRKEMPSSSNCCRFSWHSCTWKAFCSSVRILGMNLEHTCLSCRSRLRIHWTVARGTPVVTAKSRTDWHQSCCSYCCTFSMWSRQRPLLGLPGQALFLVVVCKSPSQNCLCHARTLVLPRAEAP